MAKPPSQSKWVEGIEGEEPVRRLAKTALSGRLAMVQHYLPLAAHAGAEDHEHVHQLRVASRRAAATISIFSDLLPKRRRKRFEKELRSIRRAAGEARDCDVFLERWSQHDGAEKERLPDEMRSHLAEVRLKAQKKVRKVAKKQARRGFGKASRKLVERVKWRGKANEPTSANAAKRELAAILDSFFDQQPRDPTDIAGLHQLRIRGKELRYALEVFAGVLPAGARELYKEVEALQDKLGALNDHATGQQLLENWSDATRDPDRLCQFEELQAHETSALIDACDAFHAWWSTARQAAFRDEMHKVLQAPVLVETHAIGDENGNGNGELRSALVAHAMNGSS